ncbi:MAG: MaoC/PaaZ C-terminal domain-containing protein [Microvirga sp.]
MIDYEALRNRTFPEIRHTYEAKDTILYALGVGCGSDPDDLRFVYERDLEALPTMAGVLCDPGFWITDPAIGADAALIVHGEQVIRLHAPLPAAGTLVGRERIVDVVDRGRGGHAFLRTSREIVDAHTSRPIATLASTVVLRDQGGFGGPGGSLPRRDPVPDRRPDHVMRTGTLPQAALIYRLSGDLNPLHADPMIARQAGYPAPILHGLCTLGIAARAILRACCGDDPARLAEVGVRFSAPLFPGETLQSEIWRDGAIAQFRCTALERDAVVLDCGSAAIAA